MRLARISLFRAPENGAREAGEPAMAGVCGTSGRSGKLEKPVDGVAEVLHNPVSLLQMQRRRTKRCRVVEVGAAVVKA